MDSVVVPNDARAIVCVTMACFHSIEQYRTSALVIDSSMV